MACAVGYFKTNRGNKENCTKCDDGLLTSNMASTAEADCNQPFCVPGKYLNANGVCAECMKGFYKSATGNDNCTACPVDATTPNNGSTNLSNCSIVVCNTGEMRVVNNTCMKCAVGSYQPNRGEDMCIKCGDGQTTQMEGTVDMASCVPICPVGEEYDSSTKTCKKCPLGYYKSQTGNSDSCQKCPVGYTTSSTGSISSNNCTVPDCLVGTYRSSGGCKNCSIGQYQDQTSQTQCKDCPNDKNTTESEGATSIDYCIKFCAPGQEYDRSTGNCKNCPKDFYTDRSISQYCLKCPPGHITYGEGSTTCVAAPTQTPVVEQKLTYTFKLSYRVRVDCSNQAAVNGLLSNIKLKILSRLRTLAQRFLNFCVSSDVSNCFASLELRFKNCAQPQGKRRKRQTADNDFEVEAIIPNISETVTAKEDSAKVLQTESMLQEDLDTQKTEYAPPQTTLQSSTFEGKVVSCTAGSIPTNNNQSCEQCAAGSYHDSMNNRCVNCSRNFYQDQMGQTSCNKCSGAVRMYTLSEGSTAESDCVSACSTDPSYCRNGGTCQSNDVTIWCNCKERFSGTRCQEQSELTSDTPYIIGGAIGGLAAIMIIALITISIARCLKGSKATKEKYPENDIDYNGYNYNVPLQMYDNSSKRRGQPDYSRMNPAYNYEDGQFEDSFSRGRYPGYRDDNSAYRWNEASNYDT
uniref:Sushi, von Willebrand factor type A, EGF and pentraxin domain-containing protein 1-like n=1 Tax=Crassostrea virginica TaxID=6565 RepID=A0A8B8CSW6_CRAVI|nr:sushi, von Willebrand factor type A, EGF and pentraxin domain-containing protein 1-like [Crassostrea virginica]